MYIYCFLKENKKSMVLLINILRQNDSLAAWCMDPTTLLQPKQSKGVIQIHTKLSLTVFSVLWC